MEIVDKKFAKEVEDACESALVEIGFKRPRRGDLYLEITSDFLGWVGLNQGNHADFLRINPFVGIHCVPIMELCETLEGAKYRKGKYASYAIHLGEICPDVDEFLFQQDTDIEAEARRLSITIGQHAFPWMKEHANYEALLPLIESRVDTLGGYPQRLAAGYYLSGQAQKAHRFISLRSDLFAKNDDPRSLYKRFAEPFLKMTDEEGLRAR